MKPISIITLIAFCITSPVALAHHSRSAIYDLSKMVEVEGKVTRVVWRNPHIRFWLEGEVDGEAVIYEIESTPPGTLERHGISETLLSVGENIRVAGTPGWVDANSMEAKNILLPSGREVLIQRDSEPRWFGETLGWANENITEDRLSQAVASANGIFRVWSRDEDSSFRVRQGSSLSLVGMSEYPLTPAASFANQNFDPIADNPIPGCTPKGVPHIAGQPYPVEFIDEGERILMRIEEYDLTRIIYMMNEPASDRPTPLGRSIGRWDEGSLFVTTSSMLTPQFSASIALSSSAIVEERFDLSADQSRLNYRVTVTDPATFTEPVTREKYWIWIPGVEIQQYECTE